MFSIIAALTVSLVCFFLVFFAGLGMAAAWVRVTSRKKALLMTVRMGLSERCVSPWGHRRADPNLAAAQHGTPLARFSKHSIWCL